MTKQIRKVTTRTGFEDRFEGLIAATTPFRALQQDRFELLRDELESRRLEELYEASQAGLVRRAANEAAAVAWTTPYPLLVFPALFEEKWELALMQQERQDQVWQRSRVLLAL